MNSSKKKNSFFNKIKNHRYDYWLIGILILAAFLYAWNIWEAGEANSFYTSAIVSMTQSFKNFWYASFDPAGYITVDKPPVALWFMAISAKIFGVHGWSVVLPSILFGIGSVYLIYNVVGKRFNKVAARLSALVMTLTPIAVADSRTNNMDATLVFFLLLSVFFVQKAVIKNQQRYLWIGMSLMGISFNIKMLQAFMILPALYLYYLLAANTSWKKRIGHLAIGTIFLAVFTLAWPLSVDLTNSNSRPYEGGSETNSALELAFGYNGTQRLLGQTTGTGGAFPGMGSSSKKSNESSSTSKSSNNAQGGAPTGNQQGGTPPGGNGGTPPNGNGGGTPPNGNQQGGTPPNGNGGNAPTGNKQGGTPPKGMEMGQGGPGKNGKGGAGGGAFNTGTVGPLRLFQKELGPQISWLLIVSILGLISSFVYYRGSKDKWYKLNIKRNELILWAAWLVPVAGFFSVAGFFHPYYTIMLAPAIATLSGIGIYTMFKQWKQKNWKSLLFPTAILSTVALQAWYVNDYYSTLSIVFLVVGIIISSIMYILPWIKKGSLTTKSVATTGVILIMLFPAFWSLTPTISGESAQIPTAGPDLLSSQGGGMGTNAGGMGSQVDTALLNYVTKHQGSAEYLFATDDSSTAAPYIVKTGKAVMAMGGFNGTDPAITLKEFKQLVKDGKIKYYYSGGKAGSANSEIVSWIKKNAKTVKLSSSTSSKNSSTQGGMPGGMGGQSGTLYDLSSIYK
nr:glycosyltransferase family 39 protein [Companilactobacillus metriopterae]